MLLHASGPCHVNFMSKVASSLALAIKLIFPSKKLVGVLLCVCLGQISNNCTLLLLTGHYNRMIWKTHLSFNWTHLTCLLSYLLFGGSSSVVYETQHVEVSLITVWQLPTISPRRQSVSLLLLFMVIHTLHIATTDNIIQFKIAVGYDCSCPPKSLTNVMYSSCQVFKRKRNTYKSKDTYGFITLLLIIL